MKAHYDPEADALSIRWSNAKYAESNEVDGVILDYDETAMSLAWRCWMPQSRQSIAWETPIGDTA